MPRAFLNLLGVFRPIDGAGAQPARKCFVDRLVAGRFPPTHSVVTRGLSTGFVAGDQLSVKRKNRENKHPATACMPLRIEDAAGTVTITGVDATSAIGEFMDPASARVGETVKNQ